jgi:hypothetical protein
MIDVSVLVDKLNSFDNTHDIADFLYSQNVRGVPGRADSCVISQWISKESGRSVTTASQIKVWEWGPGAGDVLERHNQSEVVIKFIEAFDIGGFPELLIRTYPEDYTITDDN